MIKFSLILSAAAIALPVAAQQRSAPNPAPPRGGNFSANAAGAMNSRIPSTPPAVGRTFQPPIVGPQPVVISRDRITGISTNAVFPALGVTVVPTPDSSSTIFPPPGTTVIAPGIAISSSAGTFPPAPAGNVIGTPGNPLTGPATNVVGLSGNPIAGFGTNGFNAGFTNIVGITTNVTGTNLIGSVTPVDTNNPSLGNRISPRTFGVGAPVTGEMLQSPVFIIPGQPNVVPEQVAPEQFAPLPQVVPVNPRTGLRLPPPITPPPPAPRP